MPMFWLWAWGCATSPTSVTLEVDYETGAEPRTGGFVRVDDVWSLTQANLAVLFAGIPVTVPNELTEMEALGDLPEGSDGGFTAEEIRAISARTRDTPDTRANASYHVLFLDGRFEDDTGIRDAVLGVSVSGTSVVAVFRPVVDGAAGREQLRAFIEQTTVVHEVGHAVGLVNRGLPMADDHEDPENRGHDVNSDCVMYWANELAEDLAAFVERAVTEDSVVLFDDACIADVQASL